MQWVSWFFFHDYSDIDFLMLTKFGSKKCTLNNTMNKTTNLAAEVSPNVKLMQLFQKPSGEVSSR